MSEPPTEDQAFWTPTRILRSAVVVFGVLGTGMLVWLIDKAIHFPEIQARQFRRFGETVPLWTPLILFVLLSISGIIYLLWRAARRVEAGEDLYAQRHRRRPGEPDS